MRVDIEYLMGTSYAADSEDQPEWPPHPDRLFSAMVSVAKEACMGEQADDALRWLEQQDPPEIRAGEQAAEVKIVGRFVPPNYTRFREEGHLLPWLRTEGRAERVFPSQSPSESLLSFQWPNVRQYPSVFDEIVRRVGHLGHSASLVRSWTAMEPIGPNLVPHASGPLALGVPAPGRLRDLEGCYRLNQRPRPPLRMQRYKWVGEAYGRATHTEMIVLEQVEGLTIPVESTLILMHAFRRAFMSSAEGLGLLVPEIHGHDGAGHCIHMPLPFSGWENADGRILGVAVVLPNSISALNRHAVYRTCASLQHVNVPGLGRLRFSGAGASNRRTLQQQTWKGPSRKWGTVTPMLLKHRPSEKFGRHLPEMVANYCTSAGLPEPIRIQAGRHPFLAGVSRAYDFLLRRKEGEPEEKFAAHALIDFDRPVEGPMLLGKARHFGLGLLRPL